MRIVGGEKFLTTQHQRDGETGLDYRGARFYDSDVGRFLSLDPLAIDYPQVSPYNYVLSNPLVIIDPTGRSPELGGVSAAHSNEREENQAINDEEERRILFGIN